MKSEDQLYIEIERYLHKKMEGTELRAFEKHIAENPEVAQKVQVQRLAHEMIIKNRLNQLSNYSKELQQKDLKRQQYKIMAKIATGLLLAGLSIYFFTKQTVHTLPVPQTADSMHVSSNNAVIPSSTAQKSQIKEKNSSPIVLKPTVKASISKNREEAHVSEATTLPTQEHLQRPLEEKISQPDVSVVKPIVVPSHEIQGPCHQVLLKAHIETFKTCVGENEGVISVSRIQGGHKPYALKLISAVDHQERGFSGLEAGKYIVSITDSKNCTQVFEEIIIASKPCHVDHQFNPALGEVWEVPSSAVAADLYIHDQSGQLIFQKHISALDQISWDGKSLNGHLQSGIFVYLLKYTDGTQQQGNITVLQ